MQIGKLKKGSKFSLYGEKQVYVITASGFGRPQVEFKKDNVPDSPTYCTVHKRDITVEPLKLQ